MIPSFRCKPRRAVIRDKIEDNPSFWFGKMLFALERGDIRRAFEARSEPQAEAWPDSARRFRSSARGPDSYAVADREAIRQENSPPVRR